MVIERMIERIIGGMKDATETGQDRTHARTIEEDTMIMTVTEIDKTDITTINATTRK